MKMKLWIECTCGTNATITLKRTINAHEDGRVYEDFSSISDGMEDHLLFEGETKPDGVWVKCKACGNQHELTT